MTELDETSIRDEAHHTRAFLNLLTNKWAVLLIYVIGQETKRYCDIRRAIGDINQKTLTDRLRQLERDGLVHRKVYPVIPARVEYCLSELGKEVLGVANNMAEWLKKNHTEIKKAQKSYDRRQKKATR